MRKLIWILMLGLSTVGMAESLQDSMAALGPTEAIRLPSPQQLGGRPGVPSSIPTQQRVGNPNFFNGGGMGPVGGLNGFSHGSAAFGGSRYVRYSYNYQWYYYRRVVVRSVAMMPCQPRVYYVRYIPCRPCRRPCGIFRCFRRRCY